jgi:hypothetical protein
MARAGMLRLAQYSLIAPSVQLIRSLQFNNGGD